MELYIYGVVYTVLYVILCKMFIEIFAKKRFQNNSKVFFSIVSFVLLEYIVSIVFSKIIVLKQILIIILGGFYACYYFKLKLCKGFFLFLLYHGLCFATDYGVLIVSQNFISNASTSEIVSSNMSLMMGSVSQMLVFCIIIILKKYIKNENLEVLTKFEWIKFSVFPIFSIVSILSIYINFNEINSVKQKNILLCIAFGMLSMNIVVFYLIYGILVRESQINEDKLFFERIKSETEIYRQASKNYVDQRKREHEYKNEMMLISSLIDLKEYDKVVNEGNIKIGNLIALPVSVQKITLNEYKENEAEYSEEEAAAILNEKAERFIKHLKENEVQINDYHVNIERSGDKYIAHADIDATVPADFDVRKVETSDE